MHSLHLIISVVIPTCHRNDLLALCLDRLAPGVQTLPTEQYEVIVTDDGSRTTAEEMVRDRYPWARWVQGPRKGPAANRNCGAAVALGEWLVFTDDDCLPSLGWLKAYCHAVQPDTHIYEGKTTCDAGLHSPLQVAPCNYTGGVLWSCNMMVCRNTFERLGGFDEGFPVAGVEDIDFQERVTGMGYLFPFVTSAIVDHPPRRAVSGKKQARFVESHIRLWYKNGRSSSFTKGRILTHIKCKVRHILDYPASKDSVTAVFSLATELCFIAAHLRAWEKKYRNQYRVRENNYEKT